MKKYCPLNENKECLKEKCGFWNEEENACGKSLPTKIVIKKDDSTGWAWE